MSALLDKAGDVLKTIAPTIATLIGGPLAGTAVSALSQAIFGRDDASADEIGKAIATGQLTPEQLAAIRQSDNDLKARLAELQFKPEELAVADRKSARDMQAATRSHVPALLAFLITVGFIGMLVGILFGELTVAENQVALILVGTFAAGFTQVLNFFLGSSAGSADKMQHIATLIAKK